METDGLIEKHLQQLEPLEYTFDSQVKQFYAIEERERPSLDLQSFQAVRKEADFSELICHFTGVSGCIGVINTNGLFRTVQSSLERVSPFLSRFQIVDSMREHIKLASFHRICMEKLERTIQKTGIGFARFST